jgi:5-methylcytosine-specific restriction endonuclease McrA
VRKLSKHARKSARRQEYRARYAAYITSAAWRAVRLGWLDEFRLRNDLEPTCVVCGRAWELAQDDLHHHTYDRLTAELFEDLAPLCRSCHGLVHDTIRSSRHWSRMRDVAASQKVIERLRLLRGATDHRVSGHGAGQEGAA